MLLNKRGMIMKAHKVSSGNYYFLLGIKETATQEEIELAYHRALKKNEGNPGRLAFIQLAYTTLSNQTDRSQYDIVIQAGRNRKINKLKEDVVGLRIILMQLMTTQQIKKLPQHAVIKMMIDKIPVDSALYARLFNNNPINGLNKKEKDRLFAIVNYSEKILGEIMSEVSTHRQLEEDKIDEYIDTVAAIQKTVTTGDTTSIDNIRESSSKFDYYLNLIAKNIKKLGKFSLILALNFVPMTAPYIIALTASYLLMNEIPQLDKKSSLILRSHSLNEEVKKGKNSFQEILGKIKINKQYKHLINEDEHPTIDDLNTKLTRLCVTLMHLMTTKQIQDLPEDSLMKKVVQKIPPDSALHTRIFTSNPINNLEPADLAALQPIVQYSQAIIGEIQSDFSSALGTHGRVRDDKVREYCKMIDAMQEAITTQDTTQIENIMKQSSKFNYYLALIVKGINYLGLSAAGVVLEVGKLSTLPLLAMGVSIMAMDSVSNKLNTNSYMFLHSNPLQDAVKKGEQVLKKANLVPNPSKKQQK